MQDILALSDRVTLEIRPSCPLEGGNMTFRISDWEFFKIAEDCTPDFEVDHKTFQLAVDPNLQNSDHHVAIAEPEIDRQVSSN